MRLAPRNTGSALACGAASVLLLVSGCATEESASPDLIDGADFIRNQPTSTDESIVEGASTQTILNHESLADAAQSAVRVEVESAAEYDYLDVPHTLSRARVLETIGGQDLTGKTLEIWQVGTASAPMESLARPLRDGAEYVIYTEPFHLEPGKSTDQWVIVAQGSWKLAAGNSFNLDVATEDPAQLAARGIDPEVLDDVAPDQAEELRTQVWDLQLAASPEQLESSVAQAWAR
ncbi:hypothetical protein [Nocardioides zeae]|uniref:Lipoprotein n=1 Tax=Nocardioides zeae TaxID=1457234 RepID=A0A6P0HMF3_9ACTN|nr:hypothetical protein [Nocardioides zeae]NEN79470.1 hypothetical protein [Nocardioides zeae]